MYCIGVFKVFLSSDNFGIPEDVIYELCIEWVETQTEAAAAITITSASDAHEFEETKDEKKKDNLKAMVEEEFVDEDEKDVEDGENYIRGHRRILFNSIKHCIRFPTMNLQYFVSTVMTAGWLTLRQAVDIYCYIQCKRMDEEIKEKVENIWNCEWRDLNKWSWDNWD